MEKIRLAIDIGASSGRHFACYKQNGHEVFAEVYRFSNQMDLTDQGLVWDVERLFHEIVKGIKIAFRKYGCILSIGIDTWGVDYVLLDDHDDIIYPAYAYRNNRTKDAIERVHQRIGFDSLYQITGTQFQPFNTIYQLYSDQIHHRLDHAVSFLMLPEYFYFRLTGVKLHEYTNATTTGMLDLQTHTYSDKILSLLELPKALFDAPLHPGVYHPLRDEVSALVGGQTNVCVVATHDTASAIEGIDVGMHQVYVSSGTWSLVGMKVLQPIVTEEALSLNFSNEGGLGYFRFQKNIMGLWMIENLKTELRYDNYPDMITDAKASDYVETVNVNDDAFFSPVSMEKAMKSDLTRRNRPLPTTNGDIINCVFHSLAKSYGRTFDELERMTHHQVGNVTIFGGGAKNEYLNSLIRKYTSKTVYAYPIEATAIGSLHIQERYDESIR